MDIPVVRAGLVLAVYNCAEDRGDSCGVPVLSSSPGSELKVPLIQFILCMPDIPVVQKRRAHSVQKTAEIPQVLCAFVGV